MEDIMAIAFDLSPAQRLCRNWLTFKSICTCGHTGDGTGSEHTDLAVSGDGHGCCKLAGCSCSQFSWRRWTATFGRALGHVLHTRRESVSRGH